MVAGPLLVSPFSFSTVFNYRGDVYSRDCRKRCAAWVDDRAIDNFFAKPKRTLFMLDSLQHASIVYRVRSRNCRLVVALLPVTLFTF